MLHVVRARETACTRLRLVPETTAQQAITRLRLRLHQTSDTIGRDGAMPALNGIMDAYERNQLRGRDPLPSHPSKNKTITMLQPAMINQTMSWPTETLAAHRPTGACWRSFSDARSASPSSVPPMRYC